MVNGVLFERGEKIRIALASVTNLRNHYSVGTNDIGLFQIKSAMGDTLLISKRGFAEMKIVLTSTKDLIIYLNRGSNTLEEVTIVGQRKKKALDQIKQDFKDKGSFYGGKPPLLSYFFMPLTALYELVGKTPRNARRFGRIYQTEMQQDKVDVLFNKSTINAQTGLTGKELENFLVNYRPDYDKAKNWVQYDAIRWINESHEKYKDSLKKP